MDAATGARMSPTTSTVQYTIDPAKSRFTVRAFASGLLSGLGHNPTIGIREYSGRIGFAPGTLADASLEFNVNADSLAVLDDINDKDRREIERIMKEDVLETGRFPEIAFASDQVSVMQLGDTLYAVTLEGDLSLHGVTRRQTLTAQMTPADDTVRAFGEFSLRQSDFNIKLVSFAAGMLKIKNELKFSFDIVARKQG
jgi:polyisoprenoid-binding protein YceI